MYTKNWKRLQLQVGFIAHLIKNCTGIAKVMFLFPFFFPSFPFFFLFFLRAKLSTYMAMISHVSCLPAIVSQTSYKYWRAKIFTEIIEFCDLSHNHRNLHSKPLILLLNTQFIYWYIWSFFPNFFTCVRLLSTDVFPSYYLLLIWIWKVSIWLAGVVFPLSFSDIARQRLCHCSLHCLALTEWQRKAKSYKFISFHPLSHSK